MGQLNECCVTFTEVVFGSIYIAATACLIELCEIFCRNAKVQSLRRLRTRDGKTTFILKATGDNEKHLNGFA